MDALVRERTCVGEACANCVQRGEARLRCLNSERCVPPSMQDHGWRCCQWVAKDKQKLETGEVPSERALAMHRDEVFRRLRWCVDQGESHWPAHAHVHLAPGDDSNFVMGVSPYGVDGAPNPAGIAGTLEDNTDRPTGSVLLADEVFGWDCRVCQQRVEQRPRPYTGGPEPLWWWWCPRCREGSGVGKPVGKKQKARQAIAAQCKKIDFARV